LGSRNIAELQTAVDQFVDWLLAYGFSSYDHQSYFAGPIGGRAKALYYRHKLLGTVAVAPMILSEAFLPAGRYLFGSKLRFPIADAHYAMGFAQLASTTRQSRYYDIAVSFVEALLSSRCPGWERHCWGYPFDWVTRTGVMKRDTPLITTTPYVYEAFSAVHALDGNQRWLDVMESIAEHALRDIPDRELSSDVAAAGYNPHDHNGVVINASAYRAFLLSDAAKTFGNDEYLHAARRNLNFVLSNQQSNGSWFYAADGERDFVDHFHTCFVLKALAKIERLTSDGRCTNAIASGVAYYTAHLFDDENLPRPFSAAPRMTVYKRELYDYAECLNLACLLRGRFRALDERASATLADLLRNWRKPDGSFRSRRLLVGWDNVPMHRWAQSQLFRSLCLILTQRDRADSQPLALAGSG